MPSLRSLVNNIKALRIRAGRAHDKMQSANGVDKRAVEEEFNQLRLSLAHKVHTIKTKKLYKEAGLSWADFTNQKLSMSRNHANVLTHMIRIRMELLQEGFEPNELPDKLSQIKALRQVSREQLPVVWSKALSYTDIPTRPDVDRAISKA